MTERISLSWNEVKILMDATTAIHKIYQSPVFQCAFFIDLYIDPLIEFADKNGVIYHIQKSIMTKLHPIPSFKDVSVIVDNILKEYKGTENYPTVLRFLETVGTLA